MNLKQTLLKFGEENGIIIGMCAVENLPAPAPVNIPFFPYTHEQRRNPQTLLPTAKSAIVIGMGYNRQLNFDTDDKTRGRFSVGAVGLDYHIILRNVLLSLENNLIEEGFIFNSFISVDTGPLCERTLAVRAGLGYVGKHNLCISHKFGSFFNIGYMLTDFEAEDLNDCQDNYDSCGDCNACIRACPADALSESGADYTKCISYLTQKKEELTDEEQRLIGTSLYGCDICQRACPMNLDTYVGEIYDIDYIMPILSDINSLTKSGFNDKFKSTAIFWRGLRILKRNAGYALRNLSENQ
ncbi:MAG: tRNA epoxyqueuosine(34) reductase QueG [Defluviitaleaceae bacterium]|nr:tRNA epoxyqueuosine(34) reductase QueG [Defluviitaleaceae bacterium]